MIALFNDEMLAVLPTLHPLAVKPTIAATDWAGTHFIYHMELRDSVLYQRYLAPQEIELGSFTLIEQPDAILAMVGAGLGVTILPSWSVVRDAAAGTVVTRPLRGRGAFQVRWAAVVRRDGKPPYVREFIEGVRSEAALR